MSRPRKLEIDLVAILVVVAAFELTLNRLAVPVLRPAGGVVPPWHHDLDLVGLFSFHLATALAFGVGLYQSWEIVTSRAYPIVARVLVGVGAATFFTFAATSVVLPPAAETSFHLESGFTLLLLLLSLALTVRPGDARVKLGLIVITIPFLLHYYGTFAVRLLLGDAARGSGLPDRMRELGQWSVAVCSIVVALCFAPRPLWRSLLRPGPLALGGFVGSIVAVILVRHQDVGMEIASRGLGIDVGPTATTTMLVAFVVAAVAMAWALASTLTAEDHPRRLLGLGLALVCIGGYAFAWPLTLMTVAAGVLSIVQAGGRLDGGAEAAPTASAAPIIGDASWHAFTQALAAELEAELAHRGTVSLLVGRAAGTPFVVRLDRSAAPSVEITFGEVPPRAPELTLQARPDRHLGGRGHPPPPPTAARFARTGDEVFDHRFRLHDSGALASRMLDEGLRARAAAVLDGWVAAWEGAALRYHLRPGHGAPLDHPLPIRDLAAGTPASPDRLAHVFQLVAELAARV